MNNIRFAIVGCGRIAQRHAEHIAKFGKLVAACDIIKQRAKDLAITYSCSYFTSLEEMLILKQEIDVVSVCTPNGLHADHSILALNAQRHVICEKPMAISSRDCDQMIMAAQRALKHLFIVKQNRFNPPIMALKKVVDEGRLGRIFNVQLNCFWNREKNIIKNRNGRVEF